MARETWCTSPGSPSTARSHRASSTLIDLLTPLRDEAADIYTIIEGCQPQGPRALPSRRARLTGEPLRTAARRARGDTVLVRVEGAGWMRCGPDREAEDVVAVDEHDRPSLPGIQVLPSR